jgi:hypothetical protein
MTGRGEGDRERETGEIAGKREGERTESRQTERERESQGRQPCQRRGWLVGVRAAGLLGCAALCYIHCSLLHMLDEGRYPCAERINCRVDDNCRVGNINISLLLSLY